MHAGALKALEFDRIVEAVCRFAQTPPGAARLATAGAADGSARGRGRAGGDGGDGALPRRQVNALRAPAELEAILDGARGRRTRARAAASRSRSRRSSPRSTRRARHPPRAARRSRSSRAIVEALRSFEHEIADDPPQDRSRRRGGGRGEPGAEEPARSAAQAARATARHARVVPARQGHVEVSAAADRHRSQRPLRARRARGTPQRRFPGIVHGSSGSGASLFLEPLSTVEINNDIVALEQQEARGSPPHPAGVDRCVPAARRRAGAHGRRGDRTRRAAGAARALAS